MHQVRCNVGFELATLSREQPACALATLICHPARWISAATDFGSCLSSSSR